jgi:hypothetical protein
LALHHARALGREPNLHVTLQWRQAPSSRRLLNNLSVWLRRRTGLQSVWVYVREVGKLKGEHIHLLVHIPPRLCSEFRRKLEGWIEMEASEVQPTATRVDAIMAGDVHRNLKSYFLKDGSAEVRRLWVKAHHKATGGTVAGKRLKVSHSIGPTARRNAAAAALELDAGETARSLAELAN